LAAGPITGRLTSSGWQRLASPDAGLASELIAGNMVHGTSPPRDGGFSVIGTVDAATSAVLAFPGG
jgi:hypothetical protein